MPSPSKSLRTAVVVEIFTFSKLQGQRMPAFEQALKPVSEERELTVLEGVRNGRGCEALDDLLIRNSTKCSGYLFQDSPHQGLGAFLPHFY